MNRKLLGTVAYVALFIVACVIVYVVICFLTGNPLIPNPSQAPTEPPVYSWGVAKA